MESKYEKMVSLENVSCSYGKKEVLKGISFSINRGDIYGFIGPNGTGKTTTIKAITEFVNISSGRLTVDEKYRIGLVLDQNCLYSEFTAKENIEFYLRLFGLDKVKSVDYYLDLVGLSDVKNEKIMRFSKGMKRRLVLARTIAAEPNILILDEPLDGLDVSSRQMMINLLKEWVKDGERCILYTSHDMSEVERLCNRIGFLKDGKIKLEGSREELLVRDFKCLRIVPWDNEEEIINCLQDDYHEFIKKNNELFFDIDKNKIDGVVERLFERRIKMREINRVYMNLYDLYEMVNNQ